MPIYLHKYGFFQFYTLALSAISIWKFSFFPLSKISILIYSNLPFHHPLFIFLSVMEIFDKTNQFVLLGFFIYLLLMNYITSARELLNRVSCYIRPTDTCPFLISVCSTFPNQLGEPPLVVAYYYCSIFTPFQWYQGVRSQKKVASQIARSFHIEN